MSGYIYGKKAETRVNFIDSEVGLVFKTCQVDSSNAQTDEFGDKIVKAGTIYPANDSTATGIIFEDVDVTYGEKSASLVVAGRVLKDRLAIASAAVTALQSKGFTFVDVPTISRTLVTAKDFTAGTTAFGASDIAETDDGSALTITAIGSDNDTEVCTVALSSSTHKVTATKVATGETKLTCTVTDTTGATTDIVVPIVIS